jgi:hypothetical protein
LFRNFSTSANDAVWHAIGSKSCQNLNLAPKERETFPVGCCKRRPAVCGDGRDMAISFQGAQAPSLTVLEQVRSYWQGLRQ